MDNLNLVLLMNVIDGTQKIRIVKANSLETLYRGTKSHAPFFNLDVHGIYTSGDEIIIGVL